MSIPAVPFGCVEVGRFRADAPLRAEPLREAVARPPAARPWDFLAPFWAPVAPVLAFVVFAPAARPFDRVFAEVVPDAAFDADVARERLAVLLRVPALDRFVLAMNFLQTVYLSAVSVLPMGPWF